MLRLKQWLSAGMIAALTVMLGTLSLPGEAMAAGVPSKPLQVNAISGDGEVTLTWQEPVTGPAPSYRIYRDDVFIGETPDLTFVDSGVSDWSTYRYSVSAVDTDGESEPSDAVWVTVYPSDQDILTGICATGYVTNGCNATDGDDASAATYSQSLTARKATWPLPVETNLTSLFLFYDHSGSGYIQLLSGSTVLDTFNLSNGTKQTLYVTGKWHNVTAIALGTHGSSYTQISAYTLAATTDGSPTSPGNLTATISDSQIALSWDAPASGAVDLYQIYRDGELIAETPALTYVDNDVDNWNSYLYEIVAVNANGTSEPLSNRFSVYPAADNVMSGLCGTGASTSNPCDATDETDNTSVNYSSSSSTGVTWTIPTEVNLTDIYLHYGSTQTLTLYLMDGQEVVASLPLPLTFGERKSVHFSGKWHNVSAISLKGPGNTYHSFSVYTLAAMTDWTPTTPRNIGAISGDRQITLTWDHSASGPAQYYEIYRDGVKVAETSDPFYVDTGLINRKTYSYMIVAVNTAGTSKPAVVFGTPWASGSDILQGICAVQQNAYQAKELCHATDEDDVSYTYFVPNTSKDSYLSWTLPEPKDIKSFMLFYTYTFEWAPEKPIKLQLLSNGTLVAEFSVQPGQNIPLAQQGDWPAITEFRIWSQGNQNFQYLSLYLLRASDQPAPFPPANLSASIVDQGVELSWQQTSAVDYYVIYRDGVAIGMVDGSTLTYLDTTISYGETYQYTVRSIRNSEESPDSNVVTVTPVPRPDAPVGLSWTETTNGVLLTWQPAATGGSADRYNVYRDGALIATVTSPEFEDTAVAVGVTYIYTVTAENAAGESAHSAPLSVKLLPPLPAPPTNLNWTLHADGGVLITWQPPATGQVDQYRVYRDGVLVGVVTDPEFHDPDIVEGVSYTYTVTSENAAGESVPSAPLVVQILPSVPEPPTGLAWTEISGGARITWQSPNAGAPVDRYNVYRDGVLIATVTSPEFEDTTLTPGISYTYTVTSANAAGESAPSAPLVVQILPPLPEPPTDLDWTQIANGVRIIWTPPTSGSPVEHYNVYRDGVLIATVTDPEFEDTTVAEGITYIYTVTSENLAGESAHSAPLTVLILPPLPEPPTDLDWTQVTNGVRITWQPPTSGGPVQHYNVYRDGVLIATVTTPEFVDANVVHSVTYTYTITSENIAGESAHSAPLSVLLPPPLPEPPTGLTWAPTTDGVLISWQPPQSGGPVDRYHVYRDGVLIATVTSPEFEDTTVVIGVTYIYTVTSENAVGESAHSAPLSVTLLPSLPAPPTNLAWTQTANGALITWQPPISGGPVDQYNVYRDGVRIATVTDPEFEDTSLVVGVTYTYTITSENTVGESAPSAPLVVQILPPLPDVPTGLTWWMAGDDLALDWDDAQGADRYIVFRDGSQVAVVTTPQFIDPDIIDGLCYTYTVVSENLAGQSAPSAPLQACVPDKPLMPPNDIQAQPTTTTIPLTWQPITARNLGGYLIYLVDAQGQPQLIATLPPTATGYIISGLTPDTEYEVAIGVFTVAGNPSPLAYLTVHTKPDTAANIYTDPADPVLAGTVDLFGTANDPALSVWEVHIRPVGGPSWTQVASGTAKVVDAFLGTLDTTTYPDGEYEIRLAVWDNVAIVDEASITVALDNTPPVVNLLTPTANAQIGGSVDVRGTVSDAHLARWAVELSADGGQSWQEILSGTTAPGPNQQLGIWNSTTVSDGTYQIRLSAWDVVGHSSSTTPIEVEIANPQSGGPGQPGGTPTPPTPTRPGNPYQEPKPPISPTPSQPPTTPPKPITYNPPTSTTNPSEEPLSFDLAPTVFYVKSPGWQTGEVRVEWQPLPLSNADVHYDIYRLEPDGEVLVGSRLTEPIFEEVLEIPAIYFYRIEAYDRTELRASAITEPIYITKGLPLSPRPGDTTVFVAYQRRFIYTDVPAFIRQERTFMPIRFVGEALGGVVFWNEDERYATITMPYGRVLRFDVGVYHIKLYENGQFRTYIPMDVASFIEHDRIYVPVRFLSEALSFIPEWVPEPSVVVIHEAEPQ